MPSEPGVSARRTPRGFLFDALGSSGHEALAWLEWHEIGTTFSMAVRQVQHLWAAERPPQPPGYVASLPAVDSRIIARPTVLMLHRRHR